VINFGLIYGMSAYGLASRTLGIERDAAAKNYIERYFRSAYPGVSALHGRDPGAGARAQGYVETVFGRRLYGCPRSTARTGHGAAGAERAGDQRADAGHRGRPDQAEHGRGAAGARRDKAKPPRVIMQVHDELVFEVPQAELDWLRTEVPRIMAGVADLKVPLLAEVGFGPNWEQAH
jgi:DNA polymerase-1